jgi:hypothetical protein
VRAFADRPIAGEDLDTTSARRTMSIRLAAADRPLAPIARPARRPFDSVVHRGRW